VYSPSQLDAAGDVDPVAEADVYLAYGRDLQAEEILKEAMRTSPMRVAIHAKLMEIYAKRRDSKAFETVAVEAFNLTHGNGPEWAYITEMGRELDPANPMYQPGGHPGGAAATFNPGGTLAMATQPAPITAYAVRSALRGCGPRPGFLARRRT
jgi:pilus assembly protein FimV